MRSGTGAQHLYCTIQEFKMSELEKEVKAGEKRDWSITSVLYNTGVQDE